VVKAEQTVERLASVVVRRAQTGQQVVVLELVVPGDDLVDRVMALVA